MNSDLEDYIEAHISPQPVYLSKIDRDTNLHFLNGRMCSGHIQGRLLKMLTAMINPERVIELGTFTGFSALCIAEALNENAVVHTIECNDELEEVILNNISLSPHREKIILHIGDAIKEMKKYAPNFFDLGVIDADKRDYPAYFKEMIRIIRPGGYILADNTLWDGHVTETTPHSSQTKGIIEFNELVAHFPGVEVAMIPLRDGITIIRKLI